VNKDKIQSFQTTLQTKWSSHTAHGIIVNDHIYANQPLSSSLNRKGCSKQKKRNWPATVKTNWPEIPMYY